MSAEATLAVMEHATGTDAEWRMLALLANEANRDGVVTDVSMAELAERMGKTERGVGGVKKGLKKSEQLVVLDAGGGRGRRASYWINLPGLAGPQETPKDRVETPSKQTGNEGDTPPPASGNGEGRSIGSSLTTSSSSSKDAKQKDFIVATTGFLDPDVDAEGEVLADGLAFLAEGRKVGNPGKLVTAIEMAIAAAAIATFNRCFEWKGKKVSDYGLGANLTSIVERARQRPSWSVDKHVRLVESAWRVRWWEQNGSNDRRPHPNVIYGGKSFDNVVQDAGDEAAGQSPAAIKKRRYTRE